MKQILKIDFKNRKKYLFNEIDRKLIKIFKMNRVVRRIDIHNFFMFRLAKKSKRSGICAIKNLCFFTKYSRSIIKFFGMQRRHLRMQLRLSLLVGMRKIKW